MFYSHEIKGKKYIYNLSIGLDEIKLSATVDDWATADSENTPLDL